MPCLAYLRVTPVQIQLKVQDKDKDTKTWYKSGVDPVGDNGIVHSTMSRQSILMIAVLGEWPPDKIARYSLIELSIYDSVIYIISM